MEGHLILLKLIFGIVWMTGVLFISFIETPLKFRAKSVNTAIGVEIGSIVFTVLTWIELTFSLLLFILLCLSPFIFQEWILLISIFSILTFQMLDLLPKLKKHALLLINNKKLNSKKAHISYIVLEILKLTGLIVFILIQYSNLKVLL